VKPHERNFIFTLIIIALYQDSITSQATATETFQLTPHAKKLS